jgi:hypothetical protein
MSELSTVAIKDGHRGHFPHHHQPADAERADRISRLAGLERFTTARAAGPLNSAGSSTSTAAGGGTPLQQGQQPIGYFDANNAPQIARERSTVGSASATGSVGGRTTWASGSDVYDPDKMSEGGEADVETSSMGGFSDEAASLVGFGEGARTPARAHSGIGSPVVGKASAVPAYLRGNAAAGSAADGGPSGPMTGFTMAASNAPVGTEIAKNDARMIDGMTYDADVVDTSNRTPPPTGMDMDPEIQARRGLSGAETTERILRDRGEK